MPLDRLSYALEAAAVGLWDWRVETGELWWSDNLAEIHGIPAGEFDGTFETFRRFIHPADVDGFDRSLAASLAAGEDFAVEFRVPGRDGVMRWIRGQGRVYRNEQGTPQRVIGIGLDVTARRDEEIRQGLLAEMGTVLNASLDAIATLDAVSNLAIDRFADWCAIHLRRPDGLIELAAIAHADPKKIDLARSLQARIPLDPNAPIGVPNVLRSGEPEFRDAIDDELILAATGDLELAAEVRSLGLTSNLIVPMSVRGETIGAISLFTAESGRRFSTPDRELALELARRSAFALDNALLFARVQAAERQLRLVADNLPALVSYVDKDYRYRFVNRRYLDWFGVQEPDLLGRQVTDVQLAGTRGVVASQLQSAMSGSPVRYDLDTTYPVAGRRHVEVDYVPDLAPTGDVRGVVSLIVDVSDRERNHRRVAALNELTAALAGALTEDEVAECIVRFGVRALDAAAGAVLSNVNDDSELLLRAIAGFTDRFQPGHRFQTSIAALFGQSVANGMPFLLPTWAERIEAFPHHAELGPEAPRGAFAALPLIVDGRRLGVFTLAYAEDRTFQRDDVEFKLALANVCAQAFDRARIYDAERRALEQAQNDRARFAVLADASRILAASLDTDLGLERVMRLTVETLADWTTTHLFMEDGSLRRIGSAHRDPAMAAAIRELDSAFASLPGSFRARVRAEVEQGRSWFDPAVDLEKLAADAVDARHFELMTSLGFSSQIISPLMTGGRLFGTLTFLRGAGSPAFTEADLALAEELCSRTAMAIDNARLIRDAKASEARYRSLFEGVADAILVVDRDGGVRGGNPAAATLFGLELGQLAGTRLSQLVMEPAAVRALLTETWLGELEIDRANGERVPTEAQSSPVDLPTGPASLIAFRDSTHRRTLERLQRDFLAMVTHDLRSPLAAIRVQSQLMRRRGQYNEQSVEAIVSQTDRIARLINALADLVRMDSGRLDLSPRELDLVQLAREVASQEEAIVPGRTVIVEASCAVEGEWDADRVAQILANLIGNALKYGGADAPVMVTVERLESSARISVRDRGPGIPAEHLAKLFERFYRADITGAGGLGLGLYIARMLTEAHDGRIFAESTLNEGSTFTVELPLQSGA